MHVWRRTWSSEQKQALLTLLGSCCLTRTGPADLSAPRMPSPACCSVPVLSHLLAACLYRCAPSGPGLFTLRPSSSHFHCRLPLSEHSLLPMSPKAPSTPFSIASAGVGAEHATGGLRREGLEKRRMSSSSDGLPGDEPPCLGWAFAPITD